MDWKGMLDLDVMSLSNTSGISTLSSKCRFKGTVSWVAPVVVSQWLERRQETGKVPQGACDKKSQQLLLQMVLCGSVLRVPHACGLKPVCYELFQLKFHSTSSATGLSRSVYQHERFPPTRAISIS